MLLLVILGLMLHEIVVLIVILHHTFHCNTFLVGARNLSTNQMYHNKLSYVVLIVISPYGYLFVH